jgi:hypothetical protein
MALTAILFLLNDGYLENFLDAYKRSLSRTETLNVFNASLCQSPANMFVQSHTISPVFFNVGYLLFVTYTWKACVVTLIRLSEIGTFVYGSIRLYIVLGHLSIVTSFFPRPSDATAPSLWLESEILVCTLQNRCVIGARHL